jgi:hypothetical protein
LVGYAAGQTDEFQGTGVWKGVKMTREKADDNESSQKASLDDTKQKAEDKVPASTK